MKEPYIEEERDSKWKQRVEATEGDERTQGNYNGRRN